MMGGTDFFRFYSKDESNNKSNNKTKNNANSYCNIINIIDIVITL